jgi:hypothetical protein
MSREIAAVHLHIDNGGVTFSVTDSGRGPCIDITSSHFGTNRCAREVNVKRETLAALAKMFDYAAKYEGYSEPYCNCADLRDMRPSNLNPECVDSIPAHEELEKEPEEDVVIFVNGRRYWHSSSGKISYDEVVDLAGKKGDHYTVTYRWRKPSVSQGGVLSPGYDVELVDGMIFDVVSTNNA